MARHKKFNIKDGIEKRESGYYSTPTFVANFLSSELLRINPAGVKVLDPCVGKEELLVPFIQSQKICDGYDIMRLKEEYSCNFFEEDFISVFINRHKYLEQQGYDYIVMNPPYNCHESEYIVSNKSRLQRHFGVGVFNTYGLFLSAAIDISKNGCLIGAIIPDAIMTGKSYDKLRGKILKDCTILELILCPHDLFHHQYANVSSCILILRKGVEKSPILEADRSPNSEHFKYVLKNRCLRDVEYCDVVFCNKEQSRFVIGNTRKIISILSKLTPLGDRFKCGGGISTGNNFLYTALKPTGKYNVPFLTNPASSKFIAIPNMYLDCDFINQSKNDRKFIIRNKEFLNVEGIACSSVGRHFGAVYLPSTYVTGVNAAIWPPKEDLYWLLAYLNCRFITYVMKGILDRGNMTTIGGVQKLPIIDFDSHEKNRLSLIARSVLYDGVAIDSAIDEIDGIVYNHLGIDEDIREDIARFCSDITHNV